MSAAFDDDDSEVARGSEARDEETADFEWVTPELARYWLTFNTHNRNLSQSVTESFVNDMENGAWQVNGVGVQFDWNGVLIDGQKRLKAIVDSGIKQRMLIVRGLAPLAQESIDIGQVRSTANILQLRGEAHSDGMTALARMCVAFNKPGREGKKISPAEITTAIDADPSIRWIANEIVPALISTAKPGKISNPSTIGYSYWRLNQVDSEACTEFFQSVATRHHLDEGDPCLALRDRLEADRDKTRSNNIATRKTAVASFMKAWNHWRRGEKRKFLRLRYEGKNHVLIIEDPI